MRATRVAFAVAVAVLAAVPAYAQKSGGMGGSSGGMWWGPTAGVNMSTLTGSDASGSSSHTGFLAGLVAERNMGGLNFRFGAMYSQRGAEQGGATLHLNYVDIPIDLAYRFSMSGSSLTPYVLGGALLGIKVGCSVSGGGSSADCSDPAVGLDAKSLVYGVNLGAGVSFPMGANRIDVTGSYLIGMADIASSTNAKNAGFSISAAYMIPMHH